MVWKRLASLGLAFVGVAVIYFTHVRSALVMLAFCLVALTGLFVLQKNYRQAALLATAGGTIVLGALAWAVTMGGSAVLQRFASLVNTNPVQLYYGSRGVFVEEALSDVLWRYPLGYGMGWWGMTHASFGNVSVPSKVWVEVMVPAWVYDGGFPLLLGYVGALAAAMYDSTRIALTCKDRQIAFWAAVIVGLGDDPHGRLQAGPDARAIRDRCHAQGVRRGVRPRRRHRPADRFHQQG